MAHRFLRAHEDYMAAVRAVESARAELQNSELALEIASMTRSLELSEMRGARRSGT